MRSLGLALSNVRFRYEDMDMRFDFALPAGVLAALVGPSGSGKTTILNLIAGFETPLEGEVLIGGERMNVKAPSERPVTMLFQEHNLFAHLPIGTNVALGVSPALKLRDEDRARVREALKRVGLDGLEHRLPRELSGGERQRAALARALVRERPVMLLDEPFAALGPALRREMLDLVAELQRERGMTVLMVTHQPEDARRIASHTVFVHDGRVIAVKPTEELFENPDIPEVRAYLGR